MIVRVSRKNRRMTTKPEYMGSGGRTKKDKMEL